VPEGARSLQLGRGRRHPLRNASAVNRRVADWLDDVFGN
jgi:hypothetical protein